MSSASIRPPGFRNAGTATHFARALITSASLESRSQFENLDEHSRGLLFEPATALRAATDNLLREARESQAKTPFERPTALVRHHAWLTLGRQQLDEAVNEEHPISRSTVRRSSTTISPW